MEVVRVEKVSEETTEIELKFENSILRIDVHSKNYVHLYSTTPFKLSEIKSQHDLNIYLETDK
jgi:hypothetical protein